MRRPRDFRGDVGLYIGAADRWIIKLLLDLGLVLKVIEMAVTEQSHRAARKQRPVAVAPWVAVALIPVGFVWGAWLSLDAYFGMPHPDWLLYMNLLWLVPPTAAVMLALRAVRARYRTGWGALVVSVPLLVILFAFTASGLDVAWVITSALAIVAVGWLGWLAGRDLVAPADDAAAPESGHEALDSSGQALGQGVHTDKAAA